MKTTRIARILELVGGFVPGVHELILLLPAFIGLHSAARALGFDLDLGPEAVAVISVTFSCLVWFIFCSLAYSKPHRLDETTSEVSRDSGSASQRPQATEIVQVAGCTAVNHPGREADSVPLNPGQGKSHDGEDALPAGFP